MQPIRDIKVKHLLNNALTDGMNYGEVYMECFNLGCYYNGYSILTI